MIKISVVLKLISLTLLLSLISCATPGMPGYISESSSEFDGSKQISMEPAWLYDSLIKLALFKNTKMDKDTVILTVVVKGAHSFGRDESLHFNIDGDIVSFKSKDLLTDINTSEGWSGSSIGNSLYIPPSNWSSKDYRVTTEFVKRLIGADRVVVKVNLRKTYVEGVFSHDAPTLARPAFRNFMKKIEAL